MDLFFLLIQLGLEPNWVWNISPTMQILFEFYFFIFYLSEKDTYIIERKTSEEGSGFLTQLTLSFVPGFHGSESPKKESKQDQKSEAEMGSLTTRS